MDFVNEYSGVISVLGTFLSLFAIGYSHYVWRETQKTNKKNDLVLDGINKLSEKNKEDSLNFHKNFLMSQCFQKFHMFKQDPYSVLVFRMETLSENEEMSFRVQKHVKNNVTNVIDCDLKIVPIGVTIDWKKSGEPAQENGYRSGYKVEVRSSSNNSFKEGDVLFIESNGSSVNSYFIYIDDLEGDEYYCSDLGGITGSSLGMYNPPSTIDSLTFFPLIRKLD